MSLSLLNSFVSTWVRETKECKGRKRSARASLGPGLRCAVTVKQSAFHPAAAPGSQAQADTFLSPKNYQNYLDLQYAAKTLSLSVMRKQNSWRISVVPQFTALILKCININMTIHF